MKQYVIRSVLILAAVLTLSCCTSGEDKPPPRLTSQGFAIDTAQTGTVGKFGHVRMRIECAGQIDHLEIRERSYDVDLATTPDRNQFVLFGLDKRARLRTDITLDFQNYINQKLNHAGEYQFDITVKDKAGQSSSVILKIHLDQESAAVTPIETGQFEMQRIGKGSVSGSEKFGISWRTIDKIRVAIRINKRARGASKLASISLADYERLVSKQQLDNWLGAAADKDSLEFDTSSNAAKDQVMGIRALGKQYLLRVLSSSTHLSALGTTVTLEGEYKY